MNDEDKLTQILQAISELKVEISHLNQRLESKRNDIKQLDRQLQGVAALKTEIESQKKEATQLSGDIKTVDGKVDTLDKRVQKIEIQLALNDQKTNKFDYWFKAVVGGIITILLP